MGAYGCRQHADQLPLMKTQREGGLASHHSLASQAGRHAIPLCDVLLQSCGMTKDREGSFLPNERREAGGLALRLLGVCMLEEA